MAKENPGEPRTASTTVGAPARVYPEWRWRTFPVFVALGVGLLIGSFSADPDTDLNIALRVVSIFMIAYAAIHLFVMNVIVAGRIRQRNETIARGEVPDEDWEEEVVHKEG